MAEYDLHRAKKGTVMDPATLALIVAPLVAKAAEKFGEAVSEKVASSMGDKAADAGWGVLGRLALRVRTWFADNGDADGARAYELATAAPDSTKAVDRLAAALKDALEKDPALAGDVARLVEEAESAGGDLQQFSVHVRDNAQVGRITQIGSIHTGGGTVNL